MTDETDFSHIFLSHAIFVVSHRVCDTTLPISGTIAGAFGVAIYIMTDAMQKS
jgi:hypothetical protein